MQSPGIREANEEEGIRGRKIPPNRTFRESKETGWSHTPPPALPPSPPPKVGREALSPGG